MLCSSALLAVSKVFLSSYIQLSLHPLKSALNFAGSSFFFPLQARFRSSAFKPVTPKNFSSMQNLYPSSKSEDVDHGLSNGLRRAYAHVPKAVSTSSSSSSPSRHGGPTTSSGNKVCFCSISNEFERVKQLRVKGHTYPFFKSILHAFKTKD